MKQLPKSTKLPDIFISTCFAKRYTCIYRSGLSFSFSSGSQSLSGAEGEVKVRKKPPCTLGLATAVKKRREDPRSEGVRRPCGPRSKEPRWGSLGTRGSRYRRSLGLATFPTTSERLKRATRKSTMLRGAINKVSRKYFLRFNTLACHLHSPWNESFIPSKGLKSCKP